VENVTGRSKGVSTLAASLFEEGIKIWKEWREARQKAGRPEGEEEPEETLRRELREEACVEVLTARLLGYTRGKCVQGHEQGLVLVRSVWRADVRILAWEPEHEIEHRLVVPAALGARYLRYPDEGATRIHLRALVEAGLEP